MKKLIYLIFILGLLTGCYWTPIGTVTPFGMIEKDKEENANITITVIWPWDEKE